MGKIVVLNVVLLKIGFYYWKVNALVKRGIQNKEQFVKENL